MPSSLKSKIIIGLLGLALLLLLMNVSVELLSKKSSVKKIQITGSEILGNIVQVLNSYNIEQNWRKKIFFRRSKYKSLKYIYRVKTPRDLLLPFLIRDILWQFEKNPRMEEGLSISVNKERAKTILKFRNEGHLLFRLDLISDKKLIRKHSEIALIVRFKSGFSEKDIRKFLAYRYQLTFLFPPDTKLLAIKKEILQVDKEYALLYSDDVSDENYLLEPAYSKAQLSHVVFTISRDFNDAVAFYYEPKSRLARSPIFNFVSDKFRKNGRRLIPLTKLHYLHGSSENEIISRFKFFEKSGLNIGKRRLLINAEDFDALLKYLPAYFKKGNLLLQF